MRTDYFDDPVAERYDEHEADMFAPGVVDPAVAFRRLHHLSC
jgi:hypothetical protein